MKKLIILMVVFIFFTACEECEDCYNIIGDEQMETEACEMIDSCSNEDFEPIGLNECKSRNYSKTCLIAIIESDNCLQARDNFQKICEENSASSNSTAEELCNKIRLTCGYDNKSHQECLDITIPKLGEAGQDCVENANTCDSVAICMNDYL